ncbi:hypothetical protein TNCV_1234811 [Trichonephila clavipes]|nr:hypothetical protein TNCV_1234811 [Trichonephila clavipes]
MAFLEKAGKQDLILLAGEFGSEEECVERKTEEKYRPGSSTQHTQEQERKYCQAARNRAEKYRQAARNRAGKYIAGAAARARKILNSSKKNCQESSSNRARENMRLTQSNKRKRDFA